jgi:hypothetical protein
MALAQLYRRTRSAAYLQAALNVANWIVTNTFDTRGPGGYTFGTTINQFNQSVPSTNGKSTEHNIDTYAFFTMLAELTRGAARQMAQAGASSQGTPSFSCRPCSILRDTSSTRAPMPTR